MQELEHTGVVDLADVGKSTLLTVGRSRECTTPA